MRRMTAALLAALVAAPGFAQPRLDPSSLRVVRVSPARLDEAVGEFERICLATGFDAARFDAAIAASKWRYEKKPGSGAPAPDVRVSGQAMINFHGPLLQATGSFVPGQCNMEVVVRPVPADATVDVALQRVFDRILGLAPPRFAFTGETCWRWQPSPDLVSRLCRIRRSNLAAGQMAWSFQRWTAEGERRARLVPPAAGRP